MDKRNACFKFESPVQRQYKYMDKKSLNAVGRINTAEFTPHSRVPKPLLLLQLQQLEFRYMLSCHWQAFGRFYKKPFVNYPVYSAALGIENNP